MKAVLNQSEWDVALCIDLVYISCCQPQGFIHILLDPSMQRLIWKESPFSLCGDDHHPLLLYHLFSRRSLGQK